MPTIYSIGHGRRPIDQFLQLLQDNQIEIVADVRAVPRSRWPQFNQKALIAALGQAGIRYIHYKELGWKIQAPKEDFDRGLAELLTLAGEQRVCMMCSESLPDECHRKLILTPPLMELGAEIVHIFPNGELKTEERVAGD